MDFSWTNWPMLSSRIPLASYLSLPRSTPHPPVPNALYESLCSPSERKTITVRSYTSEVEGAVDFSNDGHERMAALSDWIRREGQGERCIEVVGEPASYLYFGQAGLLSSLQDMKESAALREFSWG